MNSLSGVQRIWMALTIGTVVFALSYTVSVRLRMKAIAPVTDELAWLRQEFDLRGESYERVRLLYEGYKPRCDEMCLRISRRNADLLQALKGATNVTPEIEKKLADLALIRAECQAEMLRHFCDVARAMPRAQGPRYLDDMCRTTLEVSPQSGRSMNPEVLHGHP